MNEKLSEIVYSAIALYDAQKNNALDNVETISKFKANKLYGRANISKWIADKRVHPARLGTGKTSKIGFSVRELSIAKAEDRLNSIVL